MEKTSWSQPISSMVWRAGASSGSTEIQHWRLKYSLGVIFKSGMKMSPSRSYPSSKRQSSQGSHEQLASRNATFIFGWRSRMPPPKKAAEAQHLLEGLRVNPAQAEVGLEVFRALARARRGRLVETER